MNLFQLIVLPILILFLIAGVVSLVSGRFPRRVAFFWTMVWLVAGVFIAWPGITGAIAKTVGISRGADLIFYCSILVMLIGFYMVYTRLRRLDANMTKLVRHLAIENAITPQRTSSHEEDTGAGEGE